MSILRAADISTPRSAEPLWRTRVAQQISREPDAHRELAASLGLPSQGFASPLGYWFAPEDSWETPPPYVVDLAPPARPKARPRVRSTVKRAALPDSGRRVAIAEHSRPGTVPAKSQWIELSVDHHLARIELEENAWPEARQAALLALATCWRLEAIDASIDRLIDDARGLLARGGPSSLWSGRTRSTPRDFQRAGLDLILDLPEFEGPLTDPSRFLSSREACRVYRRLCHRLGLFDWRNRIDERAEVLDGILERISSRSDHRQVVALEVLIILILAADVTLSLVFGFWE